MNKAEIIAALSELPDDTPVALDVGLEPFLELDVKIDDHGARITPADDADGAEFIQAVRIAFL